MSVARPLAWLLQGSYGNTGGNPADYDYMLQLKAMAQKYTGNAPVVYCAWCSA